MRLRINGERRELADDLSLLDLITTLNLPAERIAIELNRQVVRRGDWAETKLKEDDSIEIVHFVGGGSAPLVRRRSQNAAIEDFACVGISRRFCFNSFRCKVDKTNLTGELV